MAINQVNLTENHVDLTKNKYFPKIGNQGDSINSCASFTATYYQMSYEVGKVLNWDQKNNPRVFSTKWTYNLLNNGSDIGSKLKDIYNLFKKNGVCLNSIFEYNNKNSKEYLEMPHSHQIYKEALKYRVKNDSNNGIISVESSDELIEAIKHYLKNDHPVTISTTHIESWHYNKIKDNPNSNIDDEYIGKTICSYQSTENISKHAMTIAGFNDDIWCDINENGVLDSGELGAFKVVNSWGLTWWAHAKFLSNQFKLLNGAAYVTDNGTIWLSYDAIRDESKILPNDIDRSPALEKYIGVINDVEINKSPKALLHLEFETDDRASLYIEVNGKKLNLFNNPSTYYTPPRGSFSGAYNNMETGSFVFDLSELYTGKYFNILINNRKESANINIKNLSIEIFGNDGNSTSSSIIDLTQKLKFRDNLRYNVYFPQYKYYLGPISFANDINKYAIYGSNLAWINDRAIIYGQKDGEYGNVISGGKYSQFETLKLGVESQVGDVHSNADVINRGGTINGNLTCKTYDEQSGSIINGNINLDGSIKQDLVVLNQKVSDYFNGKVSNNNNITEVKNGETLNLSTTDLKSNIIVRSGGKIVFQENGIYNLKSLIIEPDGKIDCQSNNVKILIENNFNFGDRAEIIGDASKILIASFTSNLISIGNNVIWKGVLVAPNLSYVQLFTNNSQVYGQFLSTNIQVHQNSIIHYQPYDFTNLDVNENFVDAKDIFDIIDDKENKRFLINYKFPTATLEHIKITMVRNPNYRPSTRTIEVELDQSEGKYILPYSELYIESLGEKRVPNITEVDIFVTEDNGEYYTMKKYLNFDNLEIENVINKPNESGEGIYSLTVSNPLPDNNQIHLTIPENQEIPSKMNFIIKNSSGAIIKSWFEQNFVYGENMFSIKDANQLANGTYSLIMDINNVAVGKQIFYKTK